MTRTLEEAQAQLVAPRSRLALTEQLVGVLEYRVRRTPWACAIGVCWNTQIDLS